MNSFKERLKDHKLETIFESDKVKCYRLYEPEKGTTYSTYITFNPYCITITGDFTPSQPGNISQNGYGLGWFLKANYPDSLAEKFNIKPTWDSEKAEEYFRSYFSESNESAESLKDLNEYDFSSRELYTELIEDFNEVREYNAET